MPGKKMQSVHQVTRRQQHEDPESNDRNAIANRTKQNEHPRENAKFSKNLEMFGSEKENAEGVISESIHPRQIVRYDDGTCVLWESCVYHHCVL